MTNYNRMFNKSEGWNNNPNYEWITFMIFVIIISIFYIITIYK